MENEVLRRSRLTKEFEEVLLKEDISWRRKSRLKWAKERDCNSKLFDKMAYGKARRNYIKEIKLDDGSAVRDPQRIVDEIMGFYGNLYNEECVNRSMIEGLGWSPITDSEAGWLERPFEEAKVWRAVVDLAGDKVPGSDGFTMAFFHTCWDIVKGDITRVFAEFFANGVVCQSIKITLIPMKDMSLKVRDFRPISLVTSVYKIITKVLSRKL